MNKKTLDKLVGVLPASLKNISAYLKGNLDKSGQEALSNMTGTVAILIQFFAKDKLDQYFENLTKNKLENFGSNTYLQACLQQVSESLEEVNDTELLSMDEKSIYALLIDTLSIENDVFNEDDILTILTPKYHPIVVFVKNKLVWILRELNVEESFVSSFLKNFNATIESTIITCFGEDDYIKHLEEIKEFRFKENEAKLLWDTFKLNEIGFKDGEKLDYEETFASWEPVQSLDYNTRTNNFKERQERKGRQEIEYKNLIKQEKKLVPAQILVDNYFEANDGSSLNKVLFVVADFGKGKTVFLRQYASRLAKKYVENHEGYVPIYFNLRNFNKYSSDGTYGVIADYLLCEYGIRVEDEHYKKNNYIFLLDSLDESGELSKHYIDKVIQSIKSIQNIDKEFKRKNRIVITSRPFPDGLSFHLKAHEPFNIFDKDGASCPQYISVYGFKTEQFNHWLYSALSSVANIDGISTSGFAKEIVSTVKNNKKMDVHKKLYQEGTLSKEELKRPIFSYMIFQLIIHNIDFFDIGKIGIYLSFINLLTKEAKHVSDKSFQVNFEEEIKYRSILHSIAALWTYERQHGQQGILKKADICRVLENKQTFESDREILERYTKKGVTEIEFLSHSYFGENNNVLHFQHQSFAEILLAEYYLKVFLKYSLDQKSDIDEARTKLSLGEPTEQTMQFFMELLKLLKETVCDTASVDVIEKRKLLYPLFASLAQQENNMLYSDDLYYDWFRNTDVNETSTIAPIGLLENWAITDVKLKKIVDFSARIIESNGIVVMAKSELKNALFDGELTCFSKSGGSNFPVDIDKWIALAVGNVLHKEEENIRYFNQKVTKPNKLFEMIRGWNYYNFSSSPFWGKSLFNGIDLEKKSDEIEMRNLNVAGIDFTNSILNNINFSCADLSQTNFTRCKFSNINLSGCRLMGSTFDGVDIDSGRKNMHVGHSHIAYGVYMPIQLANLLLNMSSEKVGTRYLNNGSCKVVLNFNLGVGAEGFKQDLKQDLNGEPWHSAESIFNVLKGFLCYGLKKDLFDKKAIKSWFDYTDTKKQAMFEKMIDELS